MKLVLIHVYDDNSENTREITINIERIDSLAIIESPAKTDPFYYVCVNGYSKRIPKVDYDLLISMSS